MLLPSFSVGAYAALHSLSDLISYGRSVGECVNFLNEEAWLMVSKSYSSIPVSGPVFDGFHSGVRWLVG